MNVCVAAKHHHMLWQGGCQRVSLHDGGYGRQTLHATVGERRKDGWDAGGEGPQSGALGRGGLIDAGDKMLSNLTYRCMYFNKFV